MMMIYKILIILSNLYGFHSLDNGQATLPPMGWSSWLVYGCNECDYLYYHAQCLSEIAIEDTARLLVDEKYSQVGYKYIILDDCWQSFTRDAYRKLQPHRHFPKGIRALAQFVHDKNLKLGIFSDLGPSTGGGRPGSGGFLQLDANTFAEWGIDYVKMSAASMDPRLLDRDYISFGDYLNKTGRPMVYATSWAVYQDYYRIPVMGYKNPIIVFNLKGELVNYKALPYYCNTWRFAGDMQPTWSHILGVMDYYALRQAELRKIVHPGAWNDADVLVIGHTGITLDQSKAQMAVWSIMASPLILSVDIRNIGPEFKAVLQNEYVIAIDQDPLGIPGYKFEQHSDIDTWIRPVSPAANGEYSYALAFVNRNQFGLAIKHTVVLKTLGLNSSNGYYITDLFPPTTSRPDEVIYNMTYMKPDSVLQMKINPSGVALFKAQLVVSVDTIPVSSYTTPIANNNDVIIRYNY